MTLRQGAARVWTAASLADDAPSRLGFGGVGIASNNSGRKERDGR